MSLRILVIEDEPPSAAALAKAIRAWDPDVTIETADSVREAVRVLGSGRSPDLVFADVQLGDGQVFRLFREVTVTCPVVFATAYDEHIVRALEHNAIDYLLKPVEPARVKKALDKYVRLREHFGERLLALADAVAGRGGKSAERIVARKGSAFVAVPVERIAYFRSEQKITVLVDRAGARLLVDEPLGELEARLDARRFFRVNRQILAQIDAVAAFRPVGKGKLEVELAPEASDDVVVSQENAAAFRAWIGR